jgi:hypothetical protein
MSVRASAISRPIGFGGLRQKLEAEADKSERSINSEILWRLGQTFGEEWQRFVARMEERERSEQELRNRMMQDPEIQQWFTNAIAKFHKKTGREVRCATKAKAAFASVASKVGN